jgi:hypothetical protein
MVVNQPSPGGGGSQVDKELGGFEDRYVAANNEAKCDV